MSDTPAIDYTSRDFATIKEALKVHVQTKFPDTWTDFYESQMGVAWLELVAYVFDVLSFYLDYQANETYLPTARDRLSLIRLGKLVGYDLQAPTGASASVRATIAAIEAVDIIIPAGTTFTTSKGVVFRTLTEERITAGDTEETITMSEGSLQTDNFVSDGTSFQKFVLTEASDVESSVAVTVNAVAWTVSDSLVYGDSSSTIYSVTHDVDDIATIQMGDNTSGAAPPLGAAIVITYRVGGGVAGNINVGEISTTVQGERDGLFPIEYVAVSLYNTARGSGGEARETVEHARYWIPRWVKTNQRAVTEADFDALANAFSDATFGSPAYAKAQLRQEIPEYNLVDVYLWSRDGTGAITTPSAGLKAAVEAYFNNNGDGAVRVICTDVEVQDGVIIYINVEAEITLLSNFASADVVTGVTAALDLLFTSADNRPGEMLNLSHVYEALQSVAGVKKALIVNLIGSLETSETIATGDAINTDFGPGTLLLEPNQPVTPYGVSITDGTQVITDDGDGNLIGDIGVGTNTIDYDTGVWNISFAAIPALALPIICTYLYVADYQRGEVNETGDGVTKQFKGVVTYPPIVEYDVVTSQKGVAFTDGTQVITDDGAGNLIGDVDAAGVNRIDYDTGAYDMTFNIAPPLAASIQSTYRQLLRTPSEDIPISKNQLAVKNRYDLTTISE
jgi:hypothetical protein